MCFGVFNWVDGVVVTWVDQHSDSWCTGSCQRVWGCIMFDPLFPLPMLQAMTRTACLPLRLP